MSDSTNKSGPLPQDEPILHEKAILSPSSPPATVQAPSVSAATAHPMPQKLRAYKGIEDLDIDTSPLIEQSWLWEPMCEVPFTVQKYVDRSTMRARHDVAQDLDLSITPDPIIVQEREVYERMMSVVKQWEKTPIVWRIQDGTLQAVFLGVIRFTWSKIVPQGVFERGSRLQSWTPCTVNDVVDDINGVLNSQWSHCCVEPIARHAQRKWSRRVLWTGDAGHELSWSPFPIAPPSLSLVSLKHHLQALGRALVSLDPQWATVVRIGRRSRKTLNTWFPALLNRWDAWCRAWPEHPRSDALTPLAIQLDIPPGMHTWRDDVWAVDFPKSRPSTWKLLRTGPPSLLRCQGDAFIPSVTVMAMLGTPSTPVAALRTVPVEMWSRAVKAIVAMPRADALKTWPVRCVQSFLSAVQSRAWVDQRLTMLEWLDQAALVLQAQVDENLDESPFEDPSWSWSNVQARWLNVNTLSPDLAVPFTPCTLDGIRVRAVASFEEWRVLGSMMGNCLKDDRSDLYRREAQRQRGVLVQLNGQGLSALFLRWKTPEGSDFEVLEDCWSIAEHKGRGNSEPNVVHQNMAQKILAFFNAFLTPDGCVDSKRAAQRFGLQNITDAQIERFGLQDFCDAHIEIMTVLAHAYVPTWRTSSADRIGNTPSSLKDVSSLSELLVLFQGDDWSDHAWSIIGRTAAGSMIASFCTFCLVNAYTLIKMGLYH